MNSNTQQSEVTLVDVLLDLWRGRVFVLAGVILGVLVGFFLIATAIPHHRAHMVLAPASPLNASMSSSSERGGVFSARGQSQEGLSFTRFEAGFKGADVAGLLLRDPEITDGLARDRAFKFSRSEREWSAEKLAEYIAARVEIDPVGETVLRQFSYLHPDREFAVQFLSRLHNITDGLIRHGIRKEVNERIDYLNRALGETNNPEHRRTMTDLLLEQERLRMLVSIDQPYAASVVVSPSASVKTPWPDVMLIYPAFIFVGAFLGFVVFSLTRSGDVLAGLETLPIKQKDWFLSEGGNNNEKPQKKDRPLTGKKKKLKNKRKDLDAPSEAAE